VGGFLGTGDKQASVPYQDLRRSASGKALILARSHEELEALPAFEFGALPAPDKAFTVRTEPAPEAGAAVLPGAAVNIPGASVTDVAAGRVAAIPVALPAAPEAEPESSTERHDVASMSSESLRASRLIGAPVVDGRGDAVGAIDDLIIAPERRVHAVLTIGGVLGIGDRLVIVPIDEFEIDNTAETGDGVAEIRINMGARQLIQTKAAFSYPPRGA
jgi:sporulation protein YlmC with PRC-barrel domain